MSGKLNCKDQETPPQQHSQQNTTRFLKAPASFPLTPSETHTSGKHQASQQVVENTRPEAVRPETFGAFSTSAQRFYNTNMLAQTEQGLPFPTFDVATTLARPPMQVQPTQQFLALLAQKRTIDENQLLMQLPFGAAKQQVEKPLRPSHAQSQASAFNGALDNSKPSHLETLGDSISSLNPLPWRNTLPDGDIDQESQLIRLEQPSQPATLNLDSYTDSFVMLGTAVQPIERTGGDQKRVLLEEECQSKTSSPSSGSPLFPPLLVGTKPTVDAGTEKRPFEWGTEDDELEPMPLSSTGMTAEVDNFFCFGDPALEPSVFRENEAPAELIQQSLQGKPSYRRNSQAQAASISLSMKPESIATSKSLHAVPSIMVPPSTMADEHGPASNHEPARKKIRLTTGRAQENPQEVLERILISRGFGDNLRLSAIKGSNYETTPSALQLASYGKEVFRAVQQADTETLSALFQAGLSPNPCNQFRDAVLDLVCKRGNSKVLRCMLDHQSDIRVCDNFGRTPLHHACWSRDFHEDIVSTILKQDWQQLIMEDKRGQTPLEYVRSDLHGEWTDFLERKAADLFPPSKRLRVINAKENRPYQTLADPPHALPIHLASALSAGDITSADAIEQHWGCASSP